MKPLAVDLYAGLGGWAEGFLSEGWNIIGFDIERHNYGTGGYPGWLVLQAVLTLYGSQFKNAACIVARRRVSLSLSENVKESERLKNGGKS